MDKDIKHDKENILTRLTPVANGGGIVTIWTGIIVSLLYLGICSYLALDIL